MSALGIRGISPGCATDLVRTQTIPSTLKRSLSSRKTTETKDANKDQTTFSSAGSHTLQEAYADNAVVQMALDSARAIMDKMAFITALLDHIDKEGIDTGWVEDIVERLNGNTKTQFGGTIVEEESFLDSLLKELHQNGSDTSWVTSAMQVLSEQIEQSFGAVSKSIFIKEKNSPLDPIIEASVLSVGTSFEEINANKFSLDLNAADKHDVKSAADAFIKKLEERIAHLETYTEEVHQCFESAAQKICENSGETITPEVAPQIISEIGLQLQQGLVTPGNIHYEISPSRVQVLIQ